MSCGAAASTCLCSLGLEADAPRVRRREHTRLCLLHREPHQPSIYDVLEMALRLGADRILLCQGGHLQRLMRVSLNVPQNDVELVLRNRAEEIPWLTQLFGTN